ncbi:MAG: internal scaffolding protein [Arizlama microvirus]|nr:MAG: internal scaffolding protein [Arizlama microvirus]
MKYRRQDDQKAAEAASIACSTVNDEPSKTLQGPTAEADINNIAKAFGLTGRNMPIPAEVYDPRYYGDLSEVPDLQTALNIVREAENKFMHLPADLRRKFHDSPGVLWDFVNDPRNAEEAVTLGLLHRPPAEASTPPPSSKEGE